LTSEQIERGRVRSLLSLLSQKFPVQYRTIDSEQRQWINDLAETAQTMIDARQFFDETDFWNQLVEIVNTPDVYRARLQQQDGEVVVARVHRAKTSWQKLRI
jgi:hypothetical protein